MNWFSSTTKLLKQIWESQKTNTLALNELRDEVSKIRKLVSLREPDLMYFRLTSDGSVGEDSMKGFVSLPASVAEDVVNGGSRKLQVQVNDVPLDDQVLPGNATQSNELTVKRNDKLTLSLNDIDSSGNPGPARTQEFVVVDNLAPPLPGEMGFVVTDDSGE